MRRMQLEFRQPEQGNSCQKARMRLVQGHEHTDWMGVSTAKQAVLSTAVHGTRGQLDKVAALSMVTAVDDLQ
jgi:hypothetical protein